MMTALNTLNKSMQRDCHTVIDFADKVRYVLSKKKLELWYVRVESKKFALFLIEAGPLRILIQSPI